MRNLAGRTTVIAGTHNLGFAYEACDRLVRLEEGKVVPIDVNIYPGRVEESDENETIFRLTVLPLDEVILSDRPMQSSALSQFSGVVHSVSKENDRFRILLDCRIPIETYITGVSVKKLDVRPG